MQPQNNIQNGASVSAQPVKTAPVAPQPATAAPVKEEQKKDNLFENAPKKKSKGMLLGLVFCILLAAGGIAFGVWTMMDSKAQKDALNEQITTLKTQNSELRTQVDELSEQLRSNEVSEELDDGTALNLLQSAVEEGGYEYTIESAEVYAKNNGDDGTSYWVKYVEVGDDSSENNLNIIFVEGEDGEWTFELPGFSGYTDELISQYDVL